ncbi:hypothetical protein NO357_10655 [Marimonas arenosa]|uniref:Uncharacterized protein n=1 Tax=Marimonas arenosa TaxID=1795305 RepID=A0AAE3WCC9_9RHOB|nr:hypothetical protein [Marimonas arenosa]
MAIDKTSLQWLWALTRRKGGEKMDVAVNHTFRDGQQTLSEQFVIAKSDKRHGAIAGAPGSL